MDKTTGINNSCVYIVVLLFFLLLSFPLFSPFSSSLFFFFFLFSFLSPRRRRRIDLFSSTKSASYHNPSMCTKCPGRATCQRYHYIHVRLDENARKVRFWEHPLEPKLKHRYRCLVERKFAEDIGTPPGPIEG